MSGGTGLGLSFLTIYPHGSFVLFILGLFVIDDHLGPFLLEFTFIFLLAFISKSLFLTHMEELGIGRNRVVCFQCAQCIPVSEMITKIGFTPCFFPFLFLFLSCFSPPRTPVKVVPQIRIEREPEDNDYLWRSKGTETTL